MRSQNAQLSYDHVIHIHHVTEIELIETRWRKVTLKILKFSKIFRDHVILLLNNVTQTVLVVDCMNYIEVHDFPVFRK